MQQLFYETKQRTTPVRELVAQPRFQHVVNLPMAGLIALPDDSQGTYKKPPDRLLVIRDYRLMELTKGLKHALMDTCDNSRCYAGQYLDIPVIDMEAMLEYLCSDLDKMIGNEITPYHAVHRYVIMEILEHDAEFGHLLQGVVDHIIELFQILCRNILEHPIDHYAPHRFELQELLPSGGIVLRRVDL